MHPDLRRRNRRVHPGEAVQPDHAEKDQARKGGQGGRVAAADGRGTGNGSWLVVVDGVTVGGGTTTISGAYGSGRTKTGSHARIAVFRLEASHPGERVQTERERPSSRLSSCIKLLQSRRDVSHASSNISFCAVRRSPRVPVRVLGVPWHHRPPYLSSDQSGTLPTQPVVDFGDDLIVLGRCQEREQTESKARVEVPIRRPPVFRLVLFVQRFFQ